MEMPMAGRLGASIASALAGNHMLARIIRAVAPFAMLGMSMLCPAQNNRAAGEDHTGPLAKVAQPYIDNHEIAGAVVLIANRDRVIDREATGYADLASHEPMQSNDLFWIASMSKAMTAAALMMLVDEGN